MIGDTVSSVTRSDTSTFTSVTVAATLPGTAISYADAGRTPGQTYHYRVRAFNTGGTSAYSNAATAVVPGVGSQQAAWASGELMFCSRRFPSDRY